VAGEDHAPSLRGIADSDSARKPTLVVSDVHLGAVPTTTERAFLDFVGYAAQEASALVINGDLFDLWYAHANWVPRRYVRVLARLADAAEAGLELYFVGGNRDAIEWGGHVLAEDVGAHVLADPSEIRLGGRRVLIAHGDGARRGAAAPYRKPYPILRHPLTVWSARHLLPVDWLYQVLSARSPTRARVTRQARGESPGPKRRAAAIEAWARAQLAADPGLALVVAGHSHQPALVEVAPGQHYVNSGDWISYLTYAVLPGDERAPEVRHWPSRMAVDWQSLPRNDR
jgi:UDP-2,3-diacylglucosamine hydrolase